MWIQLSWRKWDSIKVRPAIVISASQLYVIRFPCWFLKFLFFLLFLILPKKLHWSNWSRERERERRGILELRHLFLTIEWVSHRGGHPYEFQKKREKIISLTFLLSAKCGVNKNWTQKNQWLKSISLSFLSVFNSPSLWTRCTNRVTQSTIDILSFFFFSFLLLSFSYCSKTGRKRAKIWNSYSILPITLFTHI